MTFDRAAFFAAFREKAGPLKAPQVQGLDTILTACEGAPLAHAAYILATPWHETNKTMQPVVEAYWLTERWRKENLRYYPWHGRGYVQLTWEFNYRLADEKAAEAGLIKKGELIANPDKAMEPKLAAFILRKGMDDGWFTGVSLRKCLPIAGVATRQQYMKARTIINGWDKADLIEDYAQWFERALRKGGW